MAQRLPHSRPFLAEPPKIRVKIGAGKFVPDVVLSYCRWMQHVVGIEPVITQIIRQQLIGWEIFHAGQQVAQDMRCYPQHRLAHRIQRQRVFEMTHRAHGQDEAQLGVDAPQISVRFSQTVDDIIGREQFPHE